MLHDEAGHDPARGFAGGYTLQTAAGAPSWVVSDYAGWGADAAAWEEDYTRVAALFVCGEDPAQASNAIALHPTDTDDLGLPVPVIAYAEHPNTVALGRHATTQGEAIYRALGAERVMATEGVQTTCHNMGVARMSANPADGVTNRWGQTHDVENLFVADGSAFSSAGAENPTLTIVALAIRQAEHIAGRMARGEL